MEWFTLSKHACYTHMTGHGERLYFCAGICRLEDPRITDKVEDEAKEIDIVGRVMKLAQHD